jgi:hypothetical protein
MRQEGFAPYKRNMKKLSITFINVWRVKRVLSRVINGLMAVLIQQKEAVVRPLPFEMEVKK